MANTGNMLSTAVSGLQAFQRNLVTIGNNISNVNTEGYSRQSVELSARAPNAASGGFIGTGVDVTAIRRVYDQFLVDQVVSRNSAFNQLDTLQTMASSIDELLANDDVGLNPAVQKFFNALQDVANNPTSIPARQVLISEAATLSERFQSFDQRFETLNDSVNNQLIVTTAEVSSIASSIAELNKNIVLQKNLSGGQSPNSLLDHRDRLVNQLSELVSVNTNETSDGSLSVFIGNGQTLVLGGEARTLSTTPNEFDLSRLDVSFESGTISFSINGQLNGGKIGGLLAFRENVLDPVQDSMGRIAIGLTSSINAQHQLGDDINGNPGGLFFNDIISTSPEVLASTGNNPASGTVSVAINDSNLIQASEYRLNYDGATFSLTRLSDNTVVDSGFTVTDFPRTVASDGISLNLAGGVSAGDSFLIRPVRNGAGDIGVALSSAAEFAGAASGNALGDNSNALALAGLQAQKLMGGSTESFQSAYAKLVSEVGVGTREAKVNANAQRALLDRAVESQQAVSGVNLDEEAANLLKFQQAYQAAAQVIRISDDIFQTLISVTGR
ncbi:MAG: flagellar hook-associated protein FlgK [Gammaproteobacteria bacterium]|nr:flagellar hook-associated protein FlgK [Gammaproteobacteria bacterium]MCF6261827.1 flagellar hook-associated protein FlgK [Gammaproteobacteria bacterium]